MTAKDGLRTGTGPSHSPHCVGIVLLIGRQNSAETYAKVALIWGALP